MSSGAKHPPWNERLALREAFDGAFGVDRRQRIVVWNDAMQKLLGVGAADVLGRRCCDVFAWCDESGARVCRTACPYTRFHGPVATRDLLARERRGHPVWLSVSTLASAGDPAVVHLVRDVTEQRRLADLGRRTLALLRGSVGPGQGAPPGTLTPREAEVLFDLAGGSSAAAIAQRLFISPLTARNHIRSILGKLGVHTRAEAVAAAWRQGWLTQPVPDPRVASGVEGSRARHGCSPT